jgi:hypothetical protein
MGNDIAVPGVLPAMVVGFSLCITVCAARSPAVNADPDQIRTAEYAVYGAVLSTVRKPKQDAHFLLVDDALNFNCAPDPGNPILMNGCGGMIMPRNVPHDIPSRGDYCLFLLSRESNWKPEGRLQYLVTEQSAGNRRETQIRRMRDA